MTYPLATLASPASPEVASISLYIASSFEGLRATALDISFPISRCSNATPIPLILSHCLRSTSVDPLSILLFRLLFSFFFFLSVALLFNRYDRVLCFFVAGSSGNETESRLDIRMRLSIADLKGETIPRYRYTCIFAGYVLLPVEKRE